MSKYNYRRILIIFIILLAIILAAAHILGLIFNLYYVFWWFDIVNHFLGGVLVASATVLFLPHLQKLYVMGIVLLVAILWEIFELIPTPHLVGVGYSLDSLIDIIMALVGAVFVFVINYLIKK